MCFSRWLGLFAVVGGELPDLDARVRLVLSQGLAVCNLVSRASLVVLGSAYGRIRSRGSVEERPVHTGKVAGSIPAGTTEERTPLHSS